MIRYAVIAVWILLTILAGCAPRVAPESPRATTPPPATPAPAPPRAPVSSPEDDAWAKIVAAARKEGVVVLYSTAFVADIGQRISRDFHNRYGIRVEILSGTGSILRDKIVTEQGIKKQIADVFNIGGAGSTTDLTLRGGAEKIAHELPAVKEKAAFKVDPVYSPGGEMMNWVLSYTSFVFNTNLAKAEDFRSYNDLLAPRWRGKIISPDPRGTGGGGPFYYVLRYHKALDMDFYGRLAKHDVKEWGGNPREAIRMVGRGEFAVYVGGSTDTAAPIIAEGAPLRVAAPEEGNSVTMGTILVARRAPHPNAARVFINWLLSPEGQISYGESSGSTPIRKDVPDFITPGARITPKQMWLYSWDAAEWSIRDMAAKTMEQAFGSK